MRTNNVLQIGQVADLGVGPNYIPPFTGAGTEREGIFHVIKNIWGYDLTDFEISIIDKKQFNACVIFTIFCSICAAYRNGDRFEVGIEPQEDRELRILDPSPPITSLEDFVLFAEDKLRSYPKFSLCAVFGTTGGSEFEFFISSQNLDPKTMTCRAVQRSQLTVIANIDLSPPSAAA